MRRFLKLVGLVFCTFIATMFLIASLTFLVNGQFSDGITALISALILLIPFFIWFVKKQNKKSEISENPPAGWNQIFSSVLNEQQRLDNLQHLEEIQRLNEEIAALHKEKAALQNRIQELEPLQVRNKELENLLSPELLEHNQLSQSIQKQQKELELLNQEIKQKEDEYEKAEQSLTALQKRLETAQRKLGRVHYAQQAIQNAAARYFATETFEHSILYPLPNDEVDNLLAPTVQIHLHAMDIRELRKRLKENQKQIDEILKKYEGRYQTKANRTIYNLMVIALRAELQNILYNLKYDKLDTSIDNVKAVTQKYFSYASAGNQNIAPTLAKFIGEIEFFFIQAVKIEYEYYVQRERIKEEQKALREQMRQEAAERKLLEQQQHQIEKEESKYRQEMSSISDQLAEAVPDDPRTAELEKRLHELEQQLAAVGDKKEEISRLQHGKAGYVYIISNLGSFGDHVFKIGMTRRLDPQERIDELGSASVPFPFDVHSLIFSDDAPSLENSIHKQLNDHRVNKVNLRKEFFDVTLDELEQLVYELQPTAEFKRTMLAEQYHQSMSDDISYDPIDLESDQEDEDFEN